MIMSEETQNDVASHDGEGSVTLLHSSQEEEEEGVTNCHSHHEEDLNTHRLEIGYESYSSELQMPDIMRLIQVGVNNLVNLSLVQIQRPQKYAPR